MLQLNLGLASELFGWDWKGGKGSGSDLPDYLPSRGSPFLMLSVCFLSLGNDTMLLHLSFATLASRRLTCNVSFWDRWTGLLDFWVCS